MTPRERVLTLLRGGRPDQVPWFGDLDYLATAMIARGQRPADFKQSAAYLDWHRELDLGFYADQRRFRQPQHHVHRQQRRQLLHHHRPIIQKPKHF